MRNFAFMVLPFLDKRRTDLPILLRYREATFNDILLLIENRSVDFHHNESVQKIISSYFKAYFILLGYEASRLKEPLQSK